MNEIHQLDELEKRLRIDAFGPAEAWSLGCALREKAVKSGSPIAIRIDSHGQILFQCGLPGAVSDNEAWLAGKSRLAQRLGRSSRYVRLYLDERGQSLNEAFHIPEDEFRPAGGAFPLVHRGGLVLGAVTVSGMTGEKDHRFVAEGLAEWLGASPDSGGGPGEGSKTRGVSHEQD